jgi:hypothetical protein
MSEDRVVDRALQIVVDAVIECRASVAVSRCFDGSCNNPPQSQRHDPVGSGR